MLWVRMNVEWIQIGESVARHVKQGLQSLVETIHHSDSPVRPVSRVFVS